MNDQNLMPPWKPGQSGNPKGRPKSRVPEALAKIFRSKKKAREFYSLSNKEIDDWELSVLTLNIAQLRALAKWDEAPSYPKGLAIAILSDMKDGRTATLDKLRARQFGEATQKLEITGKSSMLVRQETDAIGQLTDEQREALLNVGLELLDRKE